MASSEQELRPTGRIPSAVAAAVLSLTLAPTLPAQAPLGPFGPNAVVWPTSAGGNGHAYEAVSHHPATVSWTSARAAAEAAGGYLATLTSAAEEAFVWEIVRSNPAYFGCAFGFPFGPWIGAVQPAGSPENAGGWRWLTAEPVAYTNWGAGQPDNNQNCGGPGEKFANLYAPGTSCILPAPAGSSRWNDGANLPTCFAAVSYLVEYDLDLLCPCTPTGVGATNTPPSNVCAGFTLCAAHAASGAARLQLFNVPAGAAYGKILMSAAPMPAGSVGLGPVFGLNFDPLLGGIFFAPYLPGDPLSFVFTEVGLFPQSTFVFPPGTMTPFAGTAWDLVAGVVVPVGPAAGLHLSNVVQNVW